MNWLFWNARRVWYTNHRMCTPPPRCRHFELWFSDTWNCFSELVWSRQTNGIAWYELLIDSVLMNWYNCPGTVDEFGMQILGCACCWTQEFTRMWCSAVRYICIRWIWFDLVSYVKRILSFYSTSSLTLNTIERMICYQEVCVTILD